MMKQIFGFTPAGLTTGRNYVSYAMAHVNDNGRLVLEIRNDNGIVNDIEFTDDAEGELMMALAKRLIASIHHKHD